MSATDGIPASEWHGLAEWERTRARQAARWAIEDGASWEDTRRAVLCSLGCNLVDLIERDQRWVADLLGEPRPCARCGVLVHRTARGNWTTCSDVTGRGCGASSVAHTVDVDVAASTPASLLAIVRGEHG